MLVRFKRPWLHIVILLVALAAFLAAAVRQKQALNLSATAGGQMPYLVYAQKIAHEGLFGHFGDRNRMPLIPALASLVHHGDWEIFHQRASWLAIAASTAIVLGFWLVARRALSTWLAAAFALIVAVAVVLPQSTFLQADVPYYAMFFFSWWAMLGLIEKPTIRRSILVGTILAISYLTKASILLAVPILLAVLILRAVSLRKASDTTESPAPGRRQFLLSAAITPVVFLLIVSPYLMNNVERFGRLFYNVNTTFFVWCDSWPQAQGFAEKFQIDQHFPDAPAGQIPGPLNYLHTHTASQITQRLTYGLKTLGVLLLDSTAFKYILITAVAAMIATIARWKDARTLVRKHKWPIGFSAALLIAYLLAYSWYVLVAFGDRFVLSLLPPMLFGLFVFLHKLGPSLPTFRSKLLNLTLSEVFALMIVLLAMIELVCASAVRPMPSENFIRFYYDETYEELRRGNLPEALRGFRGILTLDPDFAAAHREWGMIALAQGRHADAIESLSRAAELEPDWADVHNSLGSALIQAGRVLEAVAALERAVELEPEYPPAWYNLCGALFQLGHTEKATNCLSRLEALSPNLAAQVRGVFISPKAPTTGG